MMIEPPEEVCVINKVQKRGTTFPVSIRNLQKTTDSNALMDTGATRSCMNYSTAYRLGKDQIKQFNTMQVLGADSSNLGAVGTISCKISLGDIEVEQMFIVCRHLRRNIILGTDFAKTNQAGVSWTRHGTRVLSVKGLPRLEVEEDELGTPVTTKHHVKIPPRYSAVFEVNLHGSCEGTKIISANKQLMEVYPNAFQHEISVKPEGNKYFPSRHNYKPRPRQDVTPSERRNSGFCPRRGGRNALHRDNKRLRNRRNRTEDSKKLDTRKKLEKVQKS